ncbi:putative LPS assembly protein LptD [Compostibacter hankyongensis]|uniref:putative LPS assembly protein LptD n=1 Tax=Compostibacter hankyongensis TaxID=1007089 RepID=UPI0031ECA425
MLFLAGVHSSFRVCAQKTTGRDAVLPAAADTLPPSPDRLPPPDIILPADSGAAQSSDSLRPAGNTTAPSRDTGTLSQDTTHVPYSKDTLDAPVKFQAEDSVTLVVPEKKIYLYKGANVDYKDINLKAGKVMLDQATQVVDAHYIKDSADEKTELPVFTQQGQEPLESDSMLYNFKSTRGKIYNTVTQQGEGFLYADQAKKQKDNSIDNAEAIFTTCDEYPPHFAFHAKKVKIIPNKLLISGPANVEIMEIPTPLFIPFAIFPLTHGQRTGILPPTYEAAQQKGIGLTNGGYYFGLGDYFDLTVRGDIYSYGSWALNLNPRYFKRYHYSGSMMLSIATTRFGDPQTSDFTRSRDFRIMWSHSMDSKARPGVTFSASVNAGTSTYNQYNVTDPSIRLNNTLSSSIAFSKAWQGSPFNLTLSANHNQNTSTRQVNITLPEAAFTMNTIYPFQPKEYAGTPKWYEKIGIGYSLNARNSVDFIDTTLLKPGFFDKFQTGIQHQVPISLTLPPLGPVTVSPSVSYTERWYTKKMYRTFDAKHNRLDTTYDKGLYTAREMTMGLSVSSAVYGMFQFNKRNRNAKVQAIRHVMRPSLSLSYKPDMNQQYYYNVKVDTSALTPYQRVSVFDGIGFGPFSEGRYGGISFGIDNNLEMKVFSKKDTATHSKKIKLLDGFGINGGYNLVADSFQLQPFSVYARTLLFDKINISASGTVDPYVHDYTGRMIDKYVWEQGRFSLGELRNGSISISTSFKSPDKKGKKEEDTQDETDQLQPGQNPLDLQQEQMRRMQENPGDFVDFDIPWSINLSYSLNFTKTRTPDYKRDTTIFAQSLNFNGDFSLTPKWKIGLSSGFDFLNKRLTYTTVNITRDLHCWRMSINIVPLGFYKSFNITLNPTAGILHDLRINRRRQFYDVFGNPQSTGGGFY